MRACALVYGRVGGQVGQIVLNALVQDIVRAVGFLHSKSVFHCDIKPANTLMRFDRSGTVHSCKRKYYKEATIKVADFGAWQADIDQAIRAVV